MENRPAVDISGIYPGYDGEDINPAILVKTMLKLQGEEEYYAGLMAGVSADVDMLKYQVRKYDEEIAAIIDKGIAHPELLPKDQQKNKEVMMAFIKTDKFAVDFNTVNDLKGAVELQLVKKQSELNRFKLLISTIQSSINTGVQILSYIKHEARMAGSGGY